MKGIILSIFLSNVNSACTELEKENIFDSSTPTNYLDGCCYENGENVLNQFALDCKDDSFNYNDPDLSTPCARFAFPFPIKPQYDENLYTYSIEVIQKSSGEVISSLTDYFEFGGIGPSSREQELKVFYVKQRKKNEDNGPLIPVFDVQAVTDFRVKIIAHYQCKDGTKTTYFPVISGTDKYYFDVNQFSIRYSNLQSPRFVSIDDISFDECPVIDFEFMNQDVLANCGNQDGFTNGLSSICEFSSEGTPSTGSDEAQIKLTDTNIPSRTDLTCAAPKPTTSCIDNDVNGDCGGDCVIVDEINFLESTDLFKLIESDCEQGNLPNDCTDCCQTIGYDVNILQKLDFEARSFYNLQIEGSNLGPWRKSDNDDIRSNTYRKSAQDRLRIQVNDSPDQPPQFKIPKTNGIVSEGNGEVMITVLNCDTSVRDCDLTVISYDPDSELAWEIQFDIYDATDNLEENERNNFKIVNTVCDNSAQCSTNILKEGELLSECDPELPDCPYDSPRLELVYVSILAQEIIPKNFFANCPDTSAQCGGIPSCVDRNTATYQYSVSNDLTIKIDDLNNNPPRFFNQRTKIYIPQSSNAILECLSWQGCAIAGSGKIEEKPIDKSILALVINSGDTSDNILVYDMDDEKTNNNADFTLKISKVEYFKENNRVYPTIADGNFVLEVEDTIVKSQIVIQLVINNGDEISFSEFDRIEFTFETCSIDTIFACESDECSCQTLKASLDVLEKNKPAKAEKDEQDGSIKEYSGDGNYIVNNEDLTNPLEINFENSNSVQFKDVYFCEIIDSDSNVPSPESGNGDFHIKFGNKIAKTFDDCSENDQPCAEPISDTDNLSLEIEKATDDIFKLNLQEASKYTYRVRVCSGESNLSVDDLGTCCGENSLIRTTTKVVIKVLDENINAPNFDLYVGPNDVQRLNEGTWVQNDDVDKTVAIVQIQDFDTDIKNTRTCFRIAAETSNLKASDYFILQSTELSTRVFKGDLVLKNSLDEDDLILNEDDTRDQDGNHFNFQFQIQACNDPNTNEINFECDRNIESDTCSNTTLEDNPGLIGQAGKGNSYLQFAIKDSNRNDPEFVNVANYKYSVLERIGEVELAPEASPVTAIDGDRCWYGNGRVQFRSSDNGLFRASGGDERTNVGEETNECLASTAGKSSEIPCTADITVEPYVGAEGFTNNIDREKIESYSFTVVAFDIPVNAVEERSASAIVSIDILDINDNAPEFVETSVQISLLEGTSERKEPIFNNFNNPSTEFYVCEAVDADSDEYSTELNEYSIVSIQGCLCDCADPACYINDDFSNYFEVNSTAQVVQSQNCPDGVVQFNVKKPFSQFDQNPGLNREIVPFYKIEVAVSDPNCLRKIDTCTEDICHDCSPSATKMIYITVEDVNDNGPLIVNTAKDLTIQAGSGVGVNIIETVQIKDGDLKADFKWSEAVIVDQILLCTSSNCDDSTPYFSIDSKNSGGETYDAEFTLRTIRSIPNYGETSFFTEIKLIIQVYNSKERFAYDCSKADEIASSKCYNDESELPDIIPPNDVNSPEVGYLYNIAEITITVLDDDHIGSMRSVNDLSFWTEAELESLKSELNKIFTDTLTQPGYNSENCNNVYDTKIFKLTDSVIETDDEDEIRVVVDIEFFVEVTKTSNEPCENANPTGEDDYLSLLDQKEMTFALKTVDSFTVLKNEFGIECVMTCDDLIPPPEIHPTREEWIIIVTAIAGIALFLVVALSLTIHCIRKKNQRKLQAERSYGMKPTDPDEYDESQIERHNELEAYNIANGVAKVNPIINQEGMINLAMEYDIDEGSDTTSDSRSRFSFDSNYGNEPENIYTDPETNNNAMPPTLSNFLITGGGQINNSTNPLAGMNEDQFEDL